jgi:signal transduction histidine kinase
MIEVADSVGEYEVEAKDPSLVPIKFSADSALIRELGERLVGQPYIALAELIKNSYDADATLCLVKLEEDRITVSDNGHGMNSREFEEYWMKIGTRNKQRTIRSRRFNRPTTGSKGVGRLSAQFLAHRMQLVTTSEGDDSVRLHALVDWDSAVDAGLLTNAQALYKTTAADDARFPNESTVGTTVIMEGLKQNWGPDEVRNLGREIWGLQSPFENWGQLSSGDIDDLTFRIDFESDRLGLDRTFGQQMRAIVDSSHAIVRGTLVDTQDGKVVEVDLQFSDGDRYAQSWPVESLKADEDDWAKWVLHNASWQINIYDFVGRQPGGVPVREAREYLERFGGVSIYDAGFKLPHYGINTDWLRIEFDHAHRRSASALLPSRLQVTRALNDLPSQGRIMGVVSVNTGFEFDRAAPAERNSGEYLKILITRDRLASNDAMLQLTRAVRSSLDFYATRQRIRSDREIEIERPAEPASSKVGRLSALAAEVSRRYPNDETIGRFTTEVLDLDQTITRQERADNGERSLLGSLASTGMAALALEHENRKEIRLGRQLVLRLRRVANQSGNSELESIAGEFAEWLDRLEATRDIFAPMLSAEDRDVVEALQVSGVVRQVVRATNALMPSVDFEYDIPPDAYFPPATYADWHALIQNVLVNAANAMLDTPRPMIEFTFGRTGRSNWLRIINNGVPIDLGAADQLFEPFKRKQVITSERAALGLGGMGLGLTIVRMIASLRECNVRFVEGDGRTTFQISWSA